MKKHIISILFLLGVLTSISVLLYPFAADYVNSRSQSRVVTNYVDDVATMDDGSRQAMLDVAHEYNQNLRGNANRFKYTEEETAAYRKLLDVGHGVMGILIIDKINVNLPIYHGTDETVLQVGIGHLQGTSLPVGGSGTHAFITGHRGLPSSKLLSNLDKLAQGDTFALYILGETLTYQVDNIQTVTPDEVKALDIDINMDYCTLVTCTPYGINTHRLLVRGSRVENVAGAGWETAYADAKRLDTILIILLFLVPVLPAFLLYAIVRCVKIHKRGEMQR
jgi:sortase A